MPIYSPWATGQNGNLASFSPCGLSGQPSSFTPRKMKQMSIADNLARLHQQIDLTCRRAARPSAEVALMAVSKMHPVEVILEAHAAGQRLFGENRVQEFAEKFPLLVSLSGGMRSSSPSA